MPIWGEKSQKVPPPDEELQAGSDPEGGKISLHQGGSQKDYLVTVVNAVSYGLACYLLSMNFFVVQMKSFRSQTNQCMCTQLWYFELEWLRNASFSEDSKSTFCLLR